MTTDVPDPPTAFEAALEAAILAGAARALRKRAAVQRRRAADGTAPALADRFEQIADEFDPPGEPVPRSQIKP